VINGVAAVPVLAAMMVLCRDERIMGKFRITGWLFGLGWTTTAVMGIATLAMILQLFVF
jgi:Mn2+/Fe2+ NRAMP family transporter